MSLKLGQEQVFMTIRYDDKGKIFTDIISKETVYTTIQTLTHRIHGEVHVRQGQRLKDEINQCELFLAVTNAVVYDGNGQELFSTNFLAVHRDHIIWLAPQEDVIRSETDEIEGGAA